MSKKMLLILLVLSLVLVIVGCSEDVPEDMVLVEAGTTSEDNGEVTVEEDFYISKYHVTQAEFKEVMGFNPSLFEGNPDHPIETVTWYDAVKYANELSEAEGLDKYYDISDIEYKGEDAKVFEHPENIDDAKVTENEGANGYRLPANNEWEYAARGGTDGDATAYAGSDNLDEVGWYEGNSDAYKLEEFQEENEDQINEEILEFFSNNVMTMPVGELEANELGLYDMSGNVWDWTNTSSGSDRAGYGGSWFHYASHCEVSVSVNDRPSVSNFILSFRLARRP